VIVGATAAAVTVSVAAELVIVACRVAYHHAERCSTVRRRSHRRRVACRGRSCDCSPSSSALVAQRRRAAATTLKLAFVRSHCLVHRLGRNRRVTAAAFTVSVAPGWSPSAALLTTTTKLAPLSAVVVTGVV